MNAHVLLNLLNELGKSIKCEAYRALNRFFATSLMNSITHDHYSIYLRKLKILIKSQFWREKVTIFPSFRQHYNVRHCVTLRNL